MGVLATRTATSVLGLAAVLGLPNAALAQDAPAPTAPTADIVEQGDIIVTAQRRDERARDVPISITNVTAAQIETANILQLGDVARVTPALRFDSAGSFVQPTIRGVGTAVTTSGGGPDRAPPRGRAAIAMAICRGTRSLRLTHGRLGAYGKKKMTCTRQCRRDEAEQAGHRGG